MNCFELFDYSLPVNLKQLPKELTDNINTWKNEFENYFIAITSTQTNELHIHLVQQYLIRYYFPHNATALYWYYSLNSIKHFEEDNPIYMIRFTNFWRSVCRKIAEPLLAEPFYLSINLLLCLYICPLETLRERLSIFIISNSGMLSLNYLKNELVELFTPKVIPVFVDKIENAELILSLLPTIDIILPHNQEELVISYPLEENDRMNLLHAMRKCLLKKITVPIEIIDLAATNASLILGL
ncbi:hypothetical protein [Enterococcus hermanniensis]|uniref:Mga helix-turn-helix domain-containing protein n=1 Tax=Enterococcus hermanniensis TaxID=249189 RepID=A0A1L8TJ62_9ENTE|nr:hypothetical protein [Enterococcus hermanniensis]OJG44371.1 hypothetical protein RV04_GL000565 [Enterococcus hermanniensis]